MANMQKNKVPMPEQDPKIRIENFQEVTLGYNDEDAMLEAQRCLQCKHRPCVSGCPVNVQIPAFIHAVEKGAFNEAYQIITETNSLPAVCGRVCPQESQCEAKCVRGIKGESVAIGRLERFCADRHREQANNQPITQQTRASNGKKVAVCGAGPAGLSCAGDLAKLGYEVTVFESLHTAGGVLQYGIPAFRLPKDIVDYEIQQVKNLGVNIQLNTIIGQTLTIDDLFELGYGAVFIGSGAGLPAFLGIPGENSCGVYSANEYLTRVNLMKAYLNEYDTPILRSKHVAVVGGGNVAMDAARCAKRLGAETVSIVYRRSEEEMPARREEIHHAKEEGIRLQLLTNPVEIFADENGNVTSMRCDVMTLGEPDASGRRRPMPTGEQMTLQVEAVIIAVGTTPNPLIRMTTPGLETNQWGCVETSDGVTTSREGVFAGGDAVTGAATVILAMGAGKEAAQAIDTYLKSKEQQG
jgi:glutamate synthase (NADPH/NADH) small chain